MTLSSTRISHICDFSPRRSVFARHCWSVLHCPTGLVWEECCFQNPRERTGSLSLLLSFCVCILAPALLSSAERGFKSIWLCAGFTCLRGGHAEEIINRELVFSACARLFVPLKSQQRGEGASLSLALFWFTRFSNFRVCEGKSKLKIKALKWNKSLLKVPADSKRFLTRPVGEAHSGDGDDWDWQECR